MPRFAVYIRVSTVGQNLDGQRAEIQRWLDGNGITDAVWYIDRASGATLKRPAFERLQKAIFNGEVKMIVVWKLDRLSRSLRDGINILADWCDKGLRVVATSQAIDFSGALGKMLAAVLLGVAEMEMELRRERQAAGIKAARARGVYLGRRAGSTKSEPKRAAELRAKGLSVREVATALGIGERTASRYLGKQSQ